ncbi:MAG: hypothetical protein DI582_00615 [Azospirillum brasilense]|nr:MAG: hypothetical protein DI582_00615 [Azospirillum brasilense]
MDTGITYAGGSASIASYGGNDNPAVRAAMAAMFLSDSLPSLNFAKADSVQVQAGGAGITNNGGGIGM